MKQTKIIILVCLTIFLISSLVLAQSRSINRLDEKGIERRSEKEARRKSKSKERSSTLLEFSTSPSSGSFNRGDTFDLEVVVTPNNPPDNIWGIDGWLDYDSDVFEVISITDYLEGSEYGWASSFTIVDIATAGSVEYSKATMSGPGWTINGADQPYLIQIQVKADAPLGESIISFDPNHVGAIDQSFGAYNYNTTSATFNIQDGIDEPQISVTPTQITFPNTPVGNCAGSSITIKNIGAATLTVDSIILSDNTHFNVTESSPYSIAPNDSVLITSEFCPQANGYFDATLSVYSDATNENPVIVELFGDSPPDGVVYLPNIDTQSGTLNVPIRSSIDTDFVDDIHSVNIDIAFNQNISTYDSFILSNTMMEGWESVVVNGDTPGELHIAAMDVSSALDPTISDTLLILRFQFDGCDVMDTLHFESVYFGSSPMPKDDGVISLIPGDISGNISICNTTTVVPNVNLRYEVDGDSIAGGSSDANGDYMVSSICDYPGILTPFRSPVEWQPVSPALDMQDASWILQRSAQAMNFDDCQEQVGDTDKNGIILAHDAYLVGIWVVNDTQALSENQPNYSGEWRFMPESLEINNSGENYDFDAGIMGDVNRSWTPGSRSSASQSRRIQKESSRDGDVIVDINDGEILDNLAEIAVSVNDITGYGYTSYQAILPVDEWAQSVEIITEGTLSEDYNLLATLQEDNSILIGGYGIESLEGSGTLFKLQIQISDNFDEEIELCFDPFLFDNGDVATECGTIYLPTGIDDNSETAIPEKFSFKQNYPNPFNPVTTLDFALPEAANANLCIYNVHGQLIKTLVNEKLSAGYYSVSWNGRDANGRDVPSGIYFAVISAGKYSENRRMVLLK